MTVVAKELRNSGWSLAAFVDDGGPSHPAAAATIAFGAKGEISGSTGCNRFRGTYELDDGALVIGPLALTKMACRGERADQERVFLAIVGSRPFLRFDEGGELVLETPSGNQARFAPTR